MGPVVKGMGHLNGGCVYPAATPSLAPRAMSARDGAWDYVGKEDMLADRYNAAHLMQHIWTVNGDTVYETDGGQIPSGVTERQAKAWLKPTAVLVHRIKDESLIRLLIEGRWKP